MSRDHPILYVEILGCNDLQDRFAVVHGNHVIWCEEVMRTRTWMDIRREDFNLEKAFLYQDGVLNLKQKGLSDRLGFVMRPAEFAGFCEYPGIYRWKSITGTALRVMQPPVEKFEVNFHKQKTMEIDIQIERVEKDWGKGTWPQKS